MKYNKKQIMVNAWKIRKAANVSMAIALKAAWAVAKLEKKASDLGENSWYDHFEIKSNIWTGYNKSRTYVDMVGYYTSGNSKSYKVGYVNNMTGVAFC